MQQRPRDLSLPARLLGVVGLLLVTVACDVSALLEGVVEDGNFVLRDDQPDFRPQHDDAALVVFAQQDWGTLRVATLRVPRITALDGEEALPLEERAMAGAWLEVAQGPVEETERSDGVRVLNTSAPRFVRAVSGEAVVGVSGGLMSGTVSAQLEDGGWLEGAFVVELPAP